MKSDYSFLWGDVQPLFTVEANLKAFRDNRDKSWNRSDRIFNLVRNNNILCFHSNKDLQEDFERGRIFLDKAKSQRFLKELESDCKKHWDFFRSIRNTKLKKLPNEGILKIYMQFFDYWCNIMSYFRATQAEGTHYIIEEIKKSFSKDDMQVLMIPAELDIINKEMIDWQRIVQKSPSDKVLLRHAAKYPYIAMSHFTAEEIIDTLRQRYDNNKKNPINNKILKEKRELKKKQQSLLKNADLRLKFLVSLMHKLTLSRMVVKSCWAGTDFYMAPLMHEIGIRTGESVHDLFRYYTSKDIIDLMRGKPLSSVEKQLRKSCFVGLWKDGKITFKSGQEAEELARKELGELYNIKDTGNLKGNTANPGKARGIARILLANDVEQTKILRRDFKKGEILVTQMTQPNIMDIASKAAAFVTDEGGMLSHAAVISREFKVPCIVGTHFATQIIKDGDYIEVDANKGIVRKLKNNQQ